MDLAWWQLPGPTRYVNRAEQNLREGRAVVLLHPETLVPSLRQAISSRVVTNDFWTWRALDFRELTKEEQAYNPADLLCQHFNTDSPRVPGSVRTFIGAASCRGLVIWLDGLQYANLDVWFDFLDAYDQLARNSEPDYPLLCVPLCGVTADRRFKEYEAVALCSWESVVERHDIVLYVGELLRKRLHGGLLRETMTAICAELAGTDGELATHLSRIRLEDCLAPRERLVDIGRKRGWDAIDPLKRSWHTGMWENWSSGARLNSVAVALQNDHREIRRRIWRGQVGVIFPFIEEKRAELVELLGPRLALPVTTLAGEIDSAADLEIGQLRWCVRDLRLSSRTKSVLNRLVGIRHSLAHVIPLDYETLCGLDTLDRCVDDIARYGI